MFHFTPLLGAQSDSLACQSLLELDNGIKILVDIGWDTSFDVQLLAELERHAPTIDLVLLTHATLEHMGAYAHACKHIPSFSAIPVYSTFPVSNLGRVLLQDIYLSNPKASTPVLASPNRSVPYPPSPTETFTPATFLPPGNSGELPEGALRLPPTSAEIETYCGRIVTVKYSQPTPLHSAVARVAGKLGGVTITAYAAGHSLGGTIWKIQQAQESVVYAVDWNISKENCMRGAAFLGGEGGRVIEALLKPTALVCSAKNATVTNISGGRKKRDELLLDSVKKTVAQGGTVLIPTDSVGRVLELAYLLEHAWRKDNQLSGKGKAKGVGLHLAGRRAKRLSQVVGSMLEWMDEGIVREFEAIGEENNQRNNRRGNKNKNNDADHVAERSESGNKAGPFDFLHLKMVSTSGQLAKILNATNERGNVIIASDTSLEWGFSREALMKLAGDEKNLIVMTERAEGAPGIMSKIWEMWKKQASETKPGENVTMNAQEQLQTNYRIPLEGEELQAYQRHLAAQEVLNSQHQSLLSASGLPSAITPDQDDEDASSSSDDDSDSERQGKALTTATSKKVSVATVMMGGVAPAGGPVDIGVNVLLRGDNTYDYDVRGAKGRNRMFPFAVRRRRVDEYGEVVRPEDYMRAEERQEEDLLEETMNEKEGAARVMGKKRKWDEEASRSNTVSRKGNKVSQEIGNRKRNARRSKNRHNNNNKDDDSYDPEDHDSHQEDSSDSDSSEDEESDDVLLTPSKLATSTHSIDIKLSAVFIDFSGLHDQKSLRMLLPLIDPKRLILVAGREDETVHLAQFYLEKIHAGQRAGVSATDVFFPNVGNMVNASVDTNAWNVKLGDALVRELKWQNARGLGVVHVIGRVRAADGMEDNANGEDRSPKKQKTIEGSANAVAPAATNQQLGLDPLPPALAAATRSHAQPIHVGDIRLADLRRVLQEEGHTAEFRGEGALLVDGIVAVRKVGVANVSIEDGGSGFISMGRNGRGSFMQVRRKVYDGLAVVAAG